MQSLTCHFARRSRPSRNVMTCSACEKEIQTHSAERAVDPGVSDPRIRSDVKRSAFNRTNPQREGRVSRAESHESIQT
jgi:hypothetical protein